MRYAVLLLSSVLIVGTSAVAQTAPAAKTTSPAAKTAAPAANPAKAEATTSPAHPMTEAQAEEMLKVTHANAIGKKIVTMMLGNFQRQLPPYFPNDVVQDLETGLENVDFGAITAPIYRKHLSEQDAAAVIAFYKTPAGQHLIAALPAIQQEAVIASEQAARQVVMDVLQRHKAEIEAAKKKYEAAHSMTSQPNH